MQQTRPERGQHGDAVHRSMPFWSEHRDRAGVVEYVRWAFSSEGATGVRFGERSWPTTSRWRSTGQRWSKRRTASR
jgi:hypothetical protein